CPVVRVSQTEEAVRQRTKSCYVRRRRTKTKTMTKTMQSDCCDCYYCYCCCYYCSHRNIVHMLFVMISICFQCQRLQHSDRRALFCDANPTPTPSSESAQRVHARRDVMLGGGVVRYANEKAGERGGERERGEKREEKREERREEKRREEKRREEKRE